MDAADMEFEHVKQALAGLPHLATECDALVWRRAAELLRLAKARLPALPAKDEAVRSVACVGLACSEIGGRAFDGRAACGAVGADYRSYQPLLSEFRRKLVDDSSVGAGEPTDLKALGRCFGCEELIPPAEIVLQVFRERYVSALPLASRRFVEDAFRQYSAAAMWIVAKREKVAIDRQLLQGRVGSTSRGFLKIVSAIESACPELKDASSPRRKRKLKDVAAAAETGSPGGIERQRKRARGGQTSDLLVRK